VTTWTRRTVGKTDNTEPFAAAFEDARVSLCRPPDAAVTVDSVAPYFDGTLCSCYAGAFKAEDPSKFFGTWLTEHALTFADSILVDDRKDNCKAFAHAGGAAIQWQMDDDPRQLDEALTEWARTRAGAEERT